MKKIVSLLLLIGVAATAIPVFALDGEELTTHHRREPMYKSTAGGAFTVLGNRVRTSAPGTDSTYIGYTPGQRTAANPWSIRAGTGGAGVHRPPAAGCMWNFDASGAETSNANGFINGDSLQGWWPLRMNGRFASQWALFNNDDFNEPNGSLDWGNLTSYSPAVAQGRNFGIISAWHRDPGHAGSDDVGWTPLGGTASAWCGLRRAKDTAGGTDNVTGKPFNAEVAVFDVNNRFSNPQNPSYFPGFCDGWDQMLYRDIDMTSNLSGNLSLTFSYQTHMSDLTDFEGWFDKDPLSVTNDEAAGNCAPGNYISNTDLASDGVADSFMVYVGAPAEGTFLTAGDCFNAQATKTIYDPLRRWFDEVIQSTNPTLYKELVSDGGDNTTHLVTGANVTIQNSVLSPMLAASGGKVRLVFRVKTNNRGSDETVAANQSGGNGAAVIDDVSYAISGGASSPAGWGTFEATNSIDNTQNASNAWRSTAKPPPVFVHKHQLGAAGDPGSVYNDLCGSDPHVAGRLCSMVDGIITMGDHDLGDPWGDPAKGANKSPVGYLMSPTIQLCSNDGIEGSGGWVGGVNNIGVQPPGNAGDALFGKDILVDYEIHAAAANNPITGLLYRWDIQSWPLLDGRGKRWWSNVTRSVANYQTDAICFRSLPGITGAEGSSSADLKYTATESERPEYPDSIRIGIHAEIYSSQPGVTDPNPIGGLYWDNISLILVEGTPLPLQVEIWNRYQDAFPWNQGVTEGFTAAFDTAGALIKSGLNIGPGTGLTSWDVPGDSVVTAANGTAPLRVDLVFRILPGPGDYVTVGRPASGLAKNPQAAFGAGRTRVSAAPVASSTSFWESFMADNGAFGTAGGHGAGGNWNPNVWNSARMDTTEISVFAFQGQGIGGGPVNNNAFMGTLHEAEVGLGVPAGDPYGPRPTPRSGLGLPRHKCYLASSTAAVTDIDCVHAAGTTDGSTYDLTWVTATPGTPNAATGFNGSDVTVEGTKIIPDGLLTPGAHVQYFFRKAEGGTTAMTGMVPDTNTILPQLGERDLDGHRWQEFSILPDRWKDTGYIHPMAHITPGPPACMLVVDNQDSNTGDEAPWVGAADTLGATAQQKWGAHNGWHAPGNVDISITANVPSVSVARMGGSPGTIWDFYQIKGAEDTSPAGSFGARYAYDNGPTGSANSQVYFKRQQGGPTLDQLKAFYKIILIFSGNLNFVIWGPEPGRSMNDTQLAIDWLSSGDPITLNRVFWSQGNGFIENASLEDPATGQLDFVRNYLGADLVAGGLRTLAGAPTKTTIDLTAAPGSSLDSLGRVPVWGVRNLCNQSNDVLKVAAGDVTAQSSILTFYEDPNPADGITFPAGILKVHAATKPWAALCDGWNVGNLGSRFLADSWGRSHYFRDVLIRTFKGMCPNLGAPVVTLDVPNLDGGNMLVDFMNLRNNPLMSGMARVHFGLAKDDLVEVNVFDVGGRRIRQLANRRFKAGEHDLVWDGTDDNGHLVARGVYFTQVKYKDSAFKEAAKITVLK